MAAPDDKIRRQQLLDSQIATLRTDRRSFLARALGTGALAFGAAATLGCGEEGDSCDQTDFGIDTDPTDTALFGQIDRCDNDSGS